MLAFVRSIVIIPLFLALTMQLCQAQATISLGTGVKGVVTDSSGSVVAGATVKLLSDVAPPGETKTDGEGRFAFSGLRAGTYHVTVALAGFQEFTGGDVALVAGQQATQDVSLVTAAAAAETVNVVGNAPTVETSDPAVYNTLSAKEVTGFQLNGRNFIQLIALTPGVSNQTGQDEAKVGAQGSAAYSVNGGRVEYNSFNLDGTDLLNVGFNGGINTLIVYPSLDAIGEMKILTSNYGAQYGRTASGTVIVNTKAGTSEFHGDAYYFLRNEDLNARNFFDETKGAPLYRRNDFGLTLGGPLVIPHLYNTRRDKTFFFISEEYRSEKTPYEFNQGVPSAAERNGNFSDVCPAGGGGSKFSPAAYPDCPGLYGVPGVPNGMLVSLPGNQLSPNSRSKIAEAILSAGVIPLPNSTVGCNSSINSCYDTTISEPTHWRQELGRIDHYFNEKNRATFRYIHDAWSTITATPQYGIVTNNFPTIQNNFTGPGTSMSVRFSQTLSPSLLNEAFLSYGNSTVWLTDRNGPYGSTFLSPSSLTAACTLSVANPAGSCPIGSIFGNSSSKLPGLQFVTGPAYGGGFAVDPSYMPWYHRNPVITFGDTMSKQIGNHYFQAGGEFLLYYRTQTNSVNGAATGDTQGLFTISGSNKVLNSNLASAITGNAFFNFLEQTTSTEYANTGSPIGQLFNPAGGIESYQQDSSQLMYHQRYELGEPFFQDDWKVTPKLTLNLGLRVSLFGNFHEANDNVYNWVPSAYSQLLASQVYVNQNILYYNNAQNSAGGPLPVTYNPANPAAVLVNGLERCGYNGVPIGCMSRHLFNPAPRVGFAWDPFGTGKTSIRGGYGIFFEHGTGSETNTGSLEGSAPLVLSSTVTNPASFPCLGGSNAANCLSSFVPPGQIAAVPIDVTSLQTKTEWPYVQQWSFSLQRQLPGQTIVTAAYVGSKGTHLTAEQQINALHQVALSANPFAAGQPLTSADCANAGRVVNGMPAAIELSSGQVIAPGNPAFNNLSIACGSISSSDSNIDAYRPYLGIGRIFQLSNVADSSYNSMQLTARRTTGPITLGFSYTLSHSLDNSSDRFDNIPDAFNLHNNWASSNFDERQMLNISYILSIPVPKSFDSLRLLKNALGGWQWSGITVCQSGIPFSVINDPQGGVFTADSAGVGNSLIGTSTIQSYASVTGTPRSAPPPAGNNAQSFGPLLYNPSVFTPPQGLTFGNTGRNYLHNPSRYNFDTSLFKNFKVTEKQTIQFRAEAFNILNNTQFEIYNPAKGNQPNNTITCYGGNGAGGYTAGASECLAGNSFLRPIDAHRPRTLQLALKWLF